MFKPLATVLATTMLVASATPALAAPKAAEDNAVGLYVSNIAGSGLTYAHNFGNGWGAHISGIGWGQGPSAFFNVGGAVTREFDRREWGTLYGLVAVGTGIGGFLGTGGMTGNLDLQTNFTPGVGVTLGPVVLEGGYSIYRNSGGVGFVPAGGAGLFWRF